MSSDVWARQHLPEPLTRGASVGRYVLLDEIGAGAMGVVYSAYDPELDRKLALKLLHPNRNREAQATRRRLRREAQALARLTHPNVVGVHDVGTHAGRVFVAMEFVAGQTLRTWLGVEPPRSVVEILAVFAEAGQGLAAAHRAGLIHRDFKPENVLLAEDGRPRVVDFGLARRSEDEYMTSDDGEILTPLPDRVDPSEGFATAGARSLEISLTNTGGVMGTPAYMAPEQLLGLTATARSDQFAFCISLWEALYGQRPFHGNDLPTLIRIVTAGRITEPSSEGRYAHRGVPSHVHRALLRGLSVDPDQRFADLDELLLALRHDPARRRRHALGFVAANLLGGATLFAAGIFVADRLEPTIPEAPRCEAEAELAPLWNPERRRDLAGRFAASGLPYASFASRELERRLDGYAEQWVAVGNELCELERVQGVSQTLAMQRDCLDERRRELATFTQALLGADNPGFVAMAEHAIPAAEALAPVQRCRDPLRLHDSLADPAQREQIEALEAQLAQAEALADLGQPAEGMALAREVASSAGELGNGRTETRALLALAKFEERVGEADAAGEHLRQAYAIAEREGEDWLRAGAALELIALLGFNLERPADAAVWQAVADPLLTRVGDPPDLRGIWWFQVGRVHMRASEFVEAERALGQALALLERAHGADSAKIDPVLQALGAVARDRGDYEQALRFHRRVLARRKAAYGPDHPEVAAAYGSLGHDAYERGEYEQARDYYEKALRIVGECYGEDSPVYASRLNNYAAVLERLGHLEEAEQTHRKLLAARERRYGQDDVRVTGSLENLGLVLSSAGRFAEAAEQFERSLQIRSSHHGLDHVATATSQLNLGYAVFRLGDRARARALYEQALDTWARKLGEDHPDLALVHDNLGELELSEGHLAEARRHYDRALRLGEAALGEDAPDLGYSLTGLAQVALAAGDVDRAITDCERALTVRRGTWQPPADLGQTRLTLSQALNQRGDPGDRPRARDLAKLAEQDFAHSGDRERLQQAREWLGKL